MELVAVAALDEARVIGRNGEVPWHLPADKRQYRERVAGAPVILGRRTFEAMLDDLPGAVQIVLSRLSPEYDVPTARVVSSVEEATAAVRDLGADRAYVIGGGAIYDLFLPHVDRMVLSRVPGAHEGDTYFPDFDEQEWRRVAASEEEGFRLEEWARSR